MAIEDTPVTREDELVNVLEVLRANILIRARRGEDIAPAWVNYQAAVGEADEAGVAPPERLNLESVLREVKGITGH